MEFGAHVRGICFVLFESSDNSQRNVEAAELEHVAQYASIFSPDGTREFVDDEPKSGEYFLHDFLVWIQHVDFWGVRHIGGSVEGKDRTVSYFGRKCLGGVCFARLGQWCCQRVCSQGFAYSLRIPGILGFFYSLLFDVARFRKAENLLSHLRARLSRVGSRGGLSLVLSGQFGLVSLTPDSVGVIRRSLN